MHFRMNTETANSNQKNDSSEPPQQIGLFFFSFLLFLVAAFLLPLILSNISYSIVILNNSFSIDAVFAGLSALIVIISAFATNAFHPANKAFRSAGWVALAVSLIDLVLAVLKGLGI